MTGTPENPSNQAPATSETSTVRAEGFGREFIECNSNERGESQLRAVASSATLKLLRQWKALSPKVSDWPLPKGNSDSEILVRELILKAQGQWQFPLKDPELCHCRAVTAIRVDQAIVAGAHSVEKIRRMTSANTACGTCLPDLEKLLKFRLL